MTPRTEVIRLPFGLEARLILKPLPPPPPPWARQTNPFPPSR